MPERLRAERRARLAVAMAAEGMDVLVVAGDPWRSDYLRYAADLAPGEGQVFAFVEAGRAVRVVAESPAEAARFRAEQDNLHVTWSLSPIEEAEAAIHSLGGVRIALAPAAAVPFRLAAGALRSSVASATAMLDRLMLRKSPLEIDAIRRAAALADDGYAVFREAARPGRPEYALVAEVEGFFRSRGGTEQPVDRDLVHLERHPAVERDPRLTDRLFVYLDLQAQLVGKVSYQGPHGLLFDRQGEPLQGQAVLSGDRFRHLDGGAR